EAGLQRRHDVADDHRRDLQGRVAGPLEPVVDLDLVLVRRPAQVRGQVPRAQQMLAPVQAEADVGVADVDGQEHAITSLIRLETPAAPALPRAGTWPRRAAPVP